jgi:class 3 adenylate cyclase
MDRHYVEGATRHAVENAHMRDLEIQAKYAVKFLTYWFDEARCTAFCLVDSPDRLSIQQAHAEAHGLIPHEIIEVNPAVVEAFLGRLRDPEPPTAHGMPAREPAFRTIMCTDLQESTAMTLRVGDAKAMHLLHIHNAIIRNSLRDFRGREVRHTGDGIIASFASSEDAVECASAVQKAFGAHNDRNPLDAMHVRIGLSAGEPVEEDNTLFGSTVILAARICDHAEPDQILVADRVWREFSHSGRRFSGPIEALLKGFAEPVSLYTIEWTAEAGL